MTITKTIELAESDLAVRLKQGHKSTAYWTVTFPAETIHEFLFAEGKTIKKLSLVVDVEVSE